MEVRGGRYLDRVSDSETRRKKEATYSIKTKLRILKKDLLKNAEQERESYC